MLSRKGYDHTGNEHDSKSKQTHLAVAGECGTWRERWTVGEICARGACDAEETCGEGPAQGIAGWENHKPILHRGLEDERGPQMLTRPRLIREKVVCSSLSNLKAECDSVEWPLMKL